MKAQMYLNVPKIVVKDTPKEIPVGAMAINPNGAERISRVLDEIIECADMETSSLSK